MHLQAPVPAPALSISQQLDVLEQLLWQGGSKASTGRWAWVRQWLLKAVLGLVELQLDDVRCQYVVPGQLGPEAAQQQDAGQRDGIAVSIRSLVLTPGVAAASGAAPGATSGGTATNGANEGPAAGECSRQSLLSLQTMVPNVASCACPAKHDKIMTLATAALCILHVCLCEKPWLIRPTQESTAHCLLAGNKPASSSSSSSSQQNPVTQLSVTGVSIALMSSQPAAGVAAAATAAGPPPAPSRIGSCRPALSADLAACLLEEGWQQAHVIVKQWKCSIDVRSPSSRCTVSTASPGLNQAAEQAANVGQDQLAAVLRFKPAGVAEVSCTRS
jgi:hypothetical protein